MLTDKYPELADANIDVVPQALSQGYPAEQAAVQERCRPTQIVGPALQKVFLTGGTPASYFKEVAGQVTAKMRS